MINLLPISQIVEKATAAGVTFGFGDPKTHLAYLTKLRLLPQAVRRKINQEIEGCYPEEVISQMRKIEELKKQGLTYREIRFYLQTLPAVSSHQATPGVVFLLIGLFLGYLLAISAPAAAKMQTPTAPLAATAQSPADQSIYLIAVPNPHLYKLGKLDINSISIK